MAPFHNKEALESMKRADLQKLCKDYGVKANLKTEAIIDLLLDAQKPNNRGSATPAVSEEPPRRSVSTRLSSRSAIAGRTSSMIIHDIDEEETQVPNYADEQQVDQDHDDKPEHDIPPPPPRTRKAKDMQTRLGVGRPIAAGGKGARAVTKSVSVSRSKRTRGSRSVKPSEATIPEEEIEQIAGKVLAKSRKFQGLTVFPDTRPFSDVASSSAEKDRDPKIFSFETSEFSRPMGSEVDIEKRVADAVQPLYQQLRNLKSEFEQIQSLKIEMAKLQSQVAEMETWKHRVDSLTAEVRDLRQKAVDAESLTAEIQQLKETIFSRSDSPAAGYRTPTMTRAPIPSALSFPTAATSVDDTQSSRTAGKPRPDIAPVLLGKRHRDSTGSSVTGVVEEGQESQFSEAELARKVIRPNKKRARLTPGIEDPRNEPADVDDVDEPSEEAEQTHDAPRVPSFTVYRGPEITSPYDDPPPTTPLPRFYRSFSPSNNDAGPSRQTAGTRQENQPPFSFSFVPVPPTPGADSLYSMPNFPYPEPQSPTPAGNLPPLIGSSRDRTDIFQTFGLPPPGRPRSRLSGGPRGHDAASEMGAFINSAAFEDRTSSNDVDEPAVKEPAATTHSDKSTVKRTMYGTELEGDTRFGDFGVEGVASGFWTASQF